MLGTDGDVVSGAAAELVRTMLEDFVYQVVLDSGLKSVGYNFRYGEASPRAWVIVDKRGRPADERDERGNRRLSYDEPPLGRFIALLNTLDIP